MPTNATTNLRLATLTDVKPSAPTFNVAANVEELVVEIQIRQGDNTVDIQLGDDTAHRLGLYLLAAARRVATYDPNDEPWPPHVGQR